VDYAKFFNRSHDAVIRVYDEAGNVIETHEQTAWQISASFEAPGGANCYSVPISRSVTTLFLTLQREGVLSTPIERILYILEDRLLRQGRVLECHRLVF
jgi:hypothetical protein